MTLHQGSIVWATVADANGHNAYGRPVVIITRESEIAGAPELVGVVASNTAANQSSRRETWIELPWHPAGRVSTRLRKPTVAVCEWLAVVNPAELRDEDLGGRVPASVLEQILDVVARIHSR